jgi:hypothetical protein
MTLMFWRFPPCATNEISIHLGVLADEGEGVIHDLSDENAIERIAVMEGQGEIDFEVAEGDGQLGNACGDEVGVDGLEGEGEGEFSDVSFDGDFPKGSDAGKDDGGSFDLSSGDGWEPGVVFQEPNEGVGVEQDGHNYI